MNEKVTSVLERAIAVLARKDDVSGSWYVVLYPSSNCTSILYIVIFICEDYASKRWSLNILMEYQVFSRACFIWCEKSQFVQVTFGLSVCINCLLFARWIEIASGIRQ